MSQLNNSDETGCSGWNEIFEKLRKPMIRFAELRLPAQDKADAEDIYQVAMFRASRIDPDGIEDKANYITKIVQNLCYDQRERPWRLPPALTVLLDAQRNEENEESLPVQLPDPKRGPELDAQVKEENEEYARTLELYCADLSDRVKELLRLHVHGYTNEEIAAKTGEDVKVIRVDLNAVRNKVCYRLRSKKRTPRRWRGHS